jgi:hypothetical protein
MVSNDNVSLVAAPILGIFITLATLGSALHSVIISLESSGPLTLPTWLAAIASFVTAGVLAVTLSIAWANLIAFKSSERVRRTTELFFKFYTEEYVIESNNQQAPKLRLTPFIAMSSVITGLNVEIEVLTMVHNYLEAVAALHWKRLIDSKLYFDSFAVMLVAVYEPLRQGLAESRSPLTPYSRIPKLCADAKKYLDKRKMPAGAKSP